MLQVKDVNAFMCMLASVNVRASPQTALSEPALQLSQCKNEECPQGTIRTRGEQRLIKIHFKMSGKRKADESANYAHRLLEGIIKWVDQIHGVRRK